MFSLPFLLAPIALAILYPSFQPRDAPNRLSLSEELSKTPRVLFVTAHPDDEAMFFSPTLLALTGAGSTGKQLADVYALTLSRGNYEGLGQTRQQELEASYTKLGVPKSKLFTIDHP
jgi:N-acetylglucosaminylphosphatidylinositol deacetylase